MHTGGPSEEELKAYVAAHTEPEPANLARLERDTWVRLMNPRMCSGHLQGRLLKMLVKMSGARRVLELGTFGGYSALCLAEGIGPGGEVVTVEVDDEKEDFIRQHLARSEYGERVRLVIGDAEEYMASQEAGSFDLIFLDSDKRRYPTCYPLCKRLLRPGGIILADNVLWDGHIADLAYDRDKQTLGLREFNSIVAADPEVEVVIVPMRDGLSIIRKKNLSPFVNNKEA